MFFMIKRDKLNKGLLKVYENKVVKKQVWILTGFTTGARFKMIQRLKIQIGCFETIHNCPPGPPFLDKGGHGQDQVDIEFTSLSSLEGRCWPGVHLFLGSGQTWGTHGASLGPPKMSHFTPFRSFRALQQPQER